jgi:hypothetical protein
VEDCAAAGGTAAETAACTVGYYITAGTTTCTACAHGYYKGTIGRDDTCTACPAFSNTTAVAATGLADCKCIAGHQGQVDQPDLLDSDTGRCKRCPRGTYKELLGSFDCDDCPQGHYLNPDAVTSSDACSA